MVHYKNTLYFDGQGHIDSEAWLSHIATQQGETKLRLIRHAIALSKFTSTRKKTPLGMTCLQQGLMMADLLSDVMLDGDTICAAILYNSVYYADLDLDIVKEQLNHNVANLLYGTLRMNQISQFLELKKLKQNQVETFRKMILAIANDMRVVLLKLAERCVWMQTYKEQNLRTFEANQYARETLLIYAPLANRLGIHTLQCKLEDLAMAQTAPKLYRKIATLVGKSLLERENYLKEHADVIEIALSKSNLQDFKILTRVKNFYSSYRKMRKKNVALENIYDLYALRIIVSTVEDCYKIEKIISQIWTLIPDQSNDYIKYPKENNYQSIHLAIYGREHHRIEVQIRTFEMHQESEHGIAAHWQYKEGKLHHTSYHSKIAWLRQVLIWQRELTKNKVYLTPEFTAIIDDRVYVLTVQGDVLDLPKGSTVLDFAYHIHNKLGHFCHYATVNGQPKSLTYELHTGDQIKIFTNNTPTVDLTWLNPELGYLNTTKAKAAVLHWFQQKNYSQHIVTGQLLLEKGCRELKLHHVDYDELAKVLTFNSKKELLAALGGGELSIMQVLHTLYKTYKNPEKFLKQPIENFKEDLSNQHTVFKDFEGSVVHQSYPPVPATEYKVMEDSTIYTRSLVHSLEIHGETHLTLDLEQTVTLLLKTYSLQLLTLSVTHEFTCRKTYFLMKLDASHDNENDLLLSHLKRLYTLTKVLRFSK